MKRTTGLLMIALSLFFAAGCSKKEEPAAPAPSPAPSQSQGVIDQTSQTARQAAQEVKETVSAVVEEARQAFTMQVDLDKSVAALKAEAEQMDIALLTAVAMKYKDAIGDKQADLKALAAKLDAIPMTQRIGDDARQIGADIQKYTHMLSALKERFDVYLSAIKDKGGQVSDLTR